MPAFLYKEGKKGGEENTHICQHTWTVFGWKHGITSHWLPLLKTSQAE